MADKIQIIFKEIVEVAGSGSGAAIDDTVVSTTKTWSSQKISDELSTKADSSHTHTSSDITDLNTTIDSKISTHNTDTTAHNDIRTALNNKAEIDDTTVSTSKTYSSQKIEDRLSTKANATHTHTKADITDFSHTHNILDITNLQSSLDAKADKLTIFTQGNFVSVDSTGNIQDSGTKPSDFASATHTHNLNDLSDVDTTGVGDGQVLSYDATSGLWIPATVSGGSGSGQGVGLELIADITTTTVVQQIDATGLDLATDKEYIIELTCKKNSGNASDWLQMFVNGDTNVNNYKAYVSKNQGNWYVNAADNSASILYSQLYLIQYLLLRIKIIQNTLIIEGTGHKAIGGIYDEYHLINLVYKTSAVSNLTQITFQFADLADFAAGANLKIYRRQI